MITHLWITVIRKLALKSNWKCKVAAKMSRKRTKREVTCSTGHLTRGPRRAGARTMHEHQRETDLEASTHTQRPHSLKRSRHKERDRGLSFRFWFRARD